MHSKMAQRIRLFAMKNHYNILKFVEFPFWMMGAGLEILPDIDFSVFGDFKKFQG
jgi:hypothetical protein